MLRKIRLLLFKLWKKITGWYRPPYRNESRFMVVPPAHQPLTVNPYSIAAVLGLYRPVQQPGQYG